MTTFIQLRVEILSIILCFLLAVIFHYLLAKVALYMRND